MIIKIGLLLLTITLSSLAIINVDIELETIKDIGLALAPGILFGTFALWFTQNHVPMNRFLSRFFLLLSVWALSFLLGIYTIGIAVPFLGFITGALVHVIMFWKSTLKDPEMKRFVIGGGISGLLGYFLFMLLVDSYFSGSMVPTVVIWQTWIGIELIVSSRKNLD